MALVEYNFSNQPFRSRSWPQAYALLMPTGRAFFMGVAAGAVEQSGSSPAQKAGGRSRKARDGKAGRLGSNPARSRQWQALVKAVLPTPTAIIWR